MQKRLKSPPIYAQILAKNQGRKEDATAEFCIQVACWLTDLKKWALNTLHLGDPQAAVEQLVKTLDKIEYYLPTSELKTKEEHSYVRRT